MATYCYTTTPAEDEVIAWVIGSAQVRGIQITAPTFIASISRAHLLDWIRMKANTDTLAQQGVVGAAQDALRHTLSPTERSVLGI